MAPISTNSGVTGETMVETMVEPAMTPWIETYATQFPHEIQDSNPRSGSSSKKKNNIAFLFTGQGAQWAGMGRVAFLEFPIFRNAIQNLDIVLSRLNPRPTFKIVDMLLGNPIETSSTIDDAEIAQPLTTAIQIALVDLLAQWNIVPMVSIGHSSGEIGAAYSSGLISAPEALIIAFCRGLAVKEKSTFGSMLAVGLSANEVKQFLPSDPRKICIACENSPRSVTLSGQTKYISQLREVLTTKRIFARDLKTGRAYHSPHMEFVGEAFDKMLSSALKCLNKKDKSWRRARSPMISSVTGQPIISERIPENYWNINLKEKVIFDTAVQLLGSMYGHEEISFIEVGPQSGLASPFKQICRDGKLDRFTYISSMARNKDDVDQLLSVAETLLLAGYDVGLKGVVNALEIDAIEVQVDASTFQHGSDSSTLVSGTVITAGSSVDQDIVGKHVVAFSSDGLQPIVRTSVYAINELFGDLSSATLVGTLSPFLPLAHAYLLENNFEEGSQVLSLPGPRSVTVTTILFAQALGCELILVVTSEEEREAYISEFDLESRNLLLLSNINNFMRRMKQHPEDYSSLAVVAHDFSALSQEVWRNTPASGRFFLISDDVLHPSSDISTLSDNANLIHISSETLHSPKEATTDLLIQSLDLLNTYRELLGGGDSFLRILDVESFSSVKVDDVGYLRNNPVFRLCSS